MTGIKKALYAFWSQFGVPAYLDDQVPDNAQLPYITYTVSRAALLGTVVLTAFNWHRNEAGGNIARTSMLDAIAAAIPEAGTPCRVPGGYIILRRNPATFQTDWRDPNDPDVIAGRTSYEVTFYISGKEQ